jgi:hypothetical protein
MRWFFKLSLFVVIFFAVAKWCKSQTGSFTLSRIASNLTYEPEWDIAHCSDEIQAMLDQPYTYLAKGAQSFVFASQDGKYVIKFFRHHHLQAPLWLKVLPWAWAHSKVVKKEAKLRKDFKSYTLAYQLLRDETGLIFLHLNKTDDLQQSLVLVDKLGIRHTLNLDAYEFILQKRASLVYPALDMMMRSQQKEKAKSALTALVNFLVERSKKGIFDKDPDLNTNFGFIDDRPIQIDIGRFKSIAPHVDKEEIVRITDNLHQWLMMRYPELDDHLKQQIEQIP